MEDSHLSRCAENAHRRRWGTRHPEQSGNDENRGTLSTLTIATAKEVFELTRMINVFEVYGTEEEALRGVRQTPSDAVI